MAHSEAAQLDVVLSQLRSLVTACAARYQHESAAWFANKAVTLSGAAPRDVYALADSLFAAGDAPRALRTLELYNFLDAGTFLNPEHAAALKAAAAHATRADPAVIAASRVQPQWLPFFYLAAQCLKKMKAWDRCLALLSECMEGPTAPALETPLSTDPLLENSSTGTGAGDVVGESMLGGLADGDEGSAVGGAWQTAAPGAADASRAADISTAAAAGGALGGAGGGNSGSILGDLSDLSMLDGFGHRHGHGPSRAGAGAGAGRAAAAAMAVDRVGAGGTAAAAADGSSSGGGAQFCTWRLLRMMGLHNAAAPLHGWGDPNAGESLHLSPPALAAAAPGSSAATGDADGGDSDDDAASCGGSVAGSVASSLGDHDHHDDHHDDDDDDVPAPDNGLHGGRARAGSGTAAGSRSMARVRPGAAPATAARAARMGGGAASGASVAAGGRARASSGQAVTGAVSRIGSLQPRKGAPGAPSSAAAAARAPAKPMTHAATAAATAAAAHTPAARPAAALSSAVPAAEPAAMSAADSAPAGAAGTQAGVSGPPPAEPLMLLPRAGRVNLIASMCCLRGEALLAAGHPARARHWLIAALRIDPQAAEALQALVDHHLLSDSDEAALMQLLDKSLSAGLPRLFMRLRSLPATSGPTSSAAGNAAAGGAGASSGPGPGDEVDAATEAGSMAALLGAASAAAEGVAALQAEDAEAFLLHLYARGSSALSSQVAVPGQPALPLQQAAEAAVRPSNAAASQPAQPAQPAAQVPPAAESTGSGVAAGKAAGMGIGGRPRAASATAAATPAADARAQPPAASTTSTAAASRAGAATASSLARNSSFRQAAGGSAGPSATAAGARAAASATVPAGTGFRRAASAHVIRVGPSAGGAPAATASTAGQSAPESAAPPMPPVPAVRRLTVRRPTGGAAAAVAAGGAAAAGALGSSFAAGPHDSAITQAAGGGNGGRDAERSFAADASSTSIFGAATSTSPPAHARGDAPAPQQPPQQQSSVPSRPLPLPLVLADSRWLLSLYGMRLRRYAVSPSIHQRFGALEGSLGLGSNYDVLAAKAEALAFQHDAAAAHAITRRLVAVDAHCERTAALHYAVLMQLGKASELFALAHAAARLAPREPLSWYATGCYYMAAGQAEAAARQFAKATQLDATHAASWLGLGHAYAACSEYEPALAAYRAAMALLPNSHVPPLSMASLCVRTAQLPQAAQLLALAHSRCGSDPLLFHESGVLAYRQGRWEDARSYFAAVLALVADCPHHLRRLWEPTFFNLGHALRKLRRLPEAIEAYEAARGLAPRSAPTIAALARTHHMAGSFDAAISLYHSVSL